MPIKRLTAVSVVVAFAVIVVTALSYFGFHGIGMPMGDLNLAYQNWMNEGKPFGISEDWVYPYLALVPMILTDFASPGSLIGPWLVGVGLLLASVAGFITWKLPERGMRAMLFWFAAIMLLGPVAISRLDVVSVAIAVLGVYALIHGSETGSSVWFTVAAWIKVWPAALIAALLTVSTKRRAVLYVLGGVNGAIILVGLILGGDWSLFSFLTGQTSRGVQIEAPIAAFWLIPAALGNAQFGIQYNFHLMTFEVFGGGQEVVALLTSLAQLIAIAITVALGLAAKRKGAGFAEVFFWMSLTAVLDLIVFNKVGSPQYLTWLAVPIVFGILAGVERIRVAALAVLGLSAVTWLIYPVCYDAILQSQLLPTLLLVLRNLVLIGLLIFTNLRLQELGKKRTDDL